eukprot:g83450.t1
MRTLADHATTPSAASRVAMPQVLMTSPWKRARRHGRRRADSTASNGSNGTNGSAHHSTPSSCVMGYSTLAQPATAKQDEVNGAPLGSVPVTRRGSVPSLLIQSGFEPKASVQAFLSKLSLSNLPLFKSGCGRAPALSGKAPASC